jgi:hypothetical protein
VNVVHAIHQTENVTFLGLTLFFSESRSRRLNLIGLPGVISSGRAALAPARRHFTSFSCVVAHAPIRF